MAIAEVADPERAPEFAESGRHQEKSPGSIQLTVLREPLGAAAVELEGIDYPVTLGEKTETSVYILYGIRDEYTRGAVHSDRSHIERRVPRWQARINEGARRDYRLE